MTIIDHYHTKDDDDKFLGKTIIGVQMPNEKVLNIFFSDKTKASISFEKNHEISLSMKNSKSGKE
ncbi:MAG: hypothetical protein ACOYEJ_10100 [Mahellales bacterium]|jgi:hypothetical protein